MKVNYNNHFFLLTPDLWEHDLALVRLSRSVPSGPKYDKIKRVILPSVDNASFPGIGDDCVMKGWGCKSGGEHFGILCICSIFLKFCLLFFSQNGALILSYTCTCTYMYTLGVIVFVVNLVILVQPMQNINCIPFTYRIHFVTGAKLSFVAHSVSLPVYDRKSCAQIYGTSDIGKRICAGYLHNGKGICKASF